MKERQGLWLLLGLYLFLGLGYSLLMPMWEAPDEPDHYLYALTILEEGRPPTPEENREGFQPPLYYWMASEVLRGVEGLKSSWVVFFAPPRNRVTFMDAPVYEWSPKTYRVLVGAQVLRWVNILLGAVTIWCVYEGAKTFVEEDSGLALAVAALAGLTPQFVYISSVVTNDSLGNLAGAAMFWLMGLVMTGKVRGHWLAVTALAGLFSPLVTKLTALPIGLGLVLAVLWQVRAGWMRWKRVLVVGVGLAGAGLVGLWLFAPDAVGNIGAEFVWRLLTVRENLWEIPLSIILAAFTQSYWGKVGWLTIGVPPGLSFLLTGLVLVGWGGAFHWLAQQPREARPRWIILWITLLMTFLIVIRNTLTTPQFQGRFFFPEIGVISLLAVFGWTRLLHKWKTHAYPAVLIASLVVFNIWIWVALIIPFYFQPFWDWG